MRHVGAVGVWIVFGLTGCFRYGFGQEDGSPADRTTVSDTSDGSRADGSVDLPPWPFDGPRPDLPDGPKPDLPPHGDGPADGPVKPADGPVKPPDGPVKLPDGPIKPPDGPVIAPDQGPPCMTFEICDGKDNNCNTQIDENCVPPWWNAAYTHRLLVRLTNAQNTALASEPVFVSGSKLQLAPPIKESSIRVVRWTGTSHVEVPFALHDWNAAGDSLGDSDSDLDSNDELLLLVDIPGSGSTDYYIYYDTVNHTPKNHPTVGLTSGGSGFSRVTVNGTTADRGYLRFTDDGVALYDLMLTDSIPFWNHTNNYTYESSAIGPRINDLTLPSGTEVYPTVNHTTGNGTGKLAHTIRLGPERLDGNFSILATSQAFFQPRLVESISHSKVQAYSRPIAAVVVIDAEFYCDEPTKCSPAKDYGDVRLVGYLFNRGSQNEVLIRWRVQAQMNGTDTIAATKSAETEFYTMASYMIESYCEAQYPTLIDIDTVRIRDSTGAVSSTKFDNSNNDIRTCKDTKSWILMSDTDSPYKGVVSLLVEGLPLVNSTPLSAWRACWWGDGEITSGLELNGFQTEWHLSPSGFVSWGADKNDSTQYGYWIYAYPPSAADDQSLANTRSDRIQNPPSSAVSHETRLQITGS